MDKAGKSAALENLKGVFEGAGVVVVTHYTGLTVAEMTKLRGMLRKDGAHFKVVKNRLAKIALGGCCDNNCTAAAYPPVLVKSLSRVRLANTSMPASRNARW